MKANFDGIIRELTTFIQSDFRSLTCYLDFSLVEFRIEYLA